MSVHSPAPRDWADRVTLHRGSITISMIAVFLIIELFKVERLVRSLADADRGDKEYDAEYGLHDPENEL